MQYYLIFASKETHRCDSMEYGCMDLKKIIYEVAIILVSAFDACWLW